MTDATCSASIPDGGRAVSFHTCGRKLSGSEDYPELCGIHAAAKRRHIARHKALIVAERQAADEIKAARERATRLAARLGIGVTAQMRYPQAGVITPTGSVLVSFDDLEKLAQRYDDL